MHVFIDTNILLGFFHFSKDKLDALHTVFSPDKGGSATVYLTDQVCDEFRRNRESKIKDALQRFENAKFKAEIPHFMQEYPECEDIITLSEQLGKKRKSIMKIVKSDIQGETLPADRLIADIFKRHPVKQTTDEMFKKAWRRMTSGNPPGKNRSIGDAINWVNLLHLVPNENTLHVISEDGDYYSVLDEESAPHPFLRDEWKREKGSELRVYRKLGDFIRVHFDGVAVPFDSKIEELIDALQQSFSYAMTHQVVSELERYDYFSMKEINRILQAVSQNTQVHQIIADWDVLDFLNRIAVPRIDDIASQEYKRILQFVIDQVHQRESTVSGPLKPTDSLANTEWPF